MFHIILHVILCSKTLASLEHAAVSGALPENKKKNRFKNISACK